MISITFKRENGAVLMTVDARDFCTYLKSLGCTENSYGYLENAPYAAHAAVIQGSGGAQQISPKALTRNGGPHTYNLNEVFTRPPTSEVLKSIGNSATEIARSILDHYRPVEIKVRVLPKVAPPKPANIVAEPVSPTVEPTAATNTADF